jgi:hypothetical protein
MSAKVIRMPVVARTVTLHTLPSLAFSCRAERLFNRFEPFDQCLVLELIASLARTDAAALLATPAQRAAYDAGRRRTESDVKAHHQPNALANLPFEASFGELRRRFPGKRGGIHVDAPYSQIRLETFASGPKRSYWADRSRTSWLYSHPETRADVDQVIERLVSYMINRLHRTTWIVDRYSDGSDLPCGSGRLMVAEPDRRVSIELRPAEEASEYIQTFADRENCTPISGER